MPIFNTSLTIALLAALPTALSTTALRTQIQDVFFTRDRNLSAIIAVQPNDTLQAEAEQRFQQGVQQFQSYQLDAALNLWKQALDLYRQTGDRVGEGRVLGNLGAVYEGLGDNEQALTYFRQSLDVARVLEDLQGISFALSNIAHVYKNQGNYSQAITYREQAIALDRERNDQASEGENLSSLGSLYAAQGDYARAINTLQKSLVIAQALDDRLGEGMALGNLANVQTDQGNYAEALSNYQQALAIFREQGDRRHESNALQQLGNIYANIRNYRRSLDYYKNSLAIAQEIGDRRGEAYTLGNLGIVAREVGSMDDALQYLQQALVKVRELGDRPQEQQALNSLGIFYMQAEAYEAALEHYQQSLAIAREIGDRPAESIALGNIGIINDLLGKNEQAIDLYQQSLKIAKTSGDRIREGQALYNIGLLLFHAQKFAEALPYAQNAVAIWEAMRPGLGNEEQVYLLDSQAGTYRLLQQILIELDRPEEALAASERGRARAFVEMIANRLSEGRATLDQITPPSIDEIRAIARAQNATLVEYSIATNSDLFIWVVTPTGEIHFRRSTLQTNTSISEEGEDTRVAAALGRGGVQTEAPFSELVEEIRSSIQDSGSKSDSQTRSQLEPSQEVSSELTSTAQTRTSSEQTRTSSETVRQNERRQNRKLRQLHQLLVEPIVDLLPTDPDSHVVFVPQNSLLLLPFAALQDTDGRFLIEKHTIVTVPAIQVLALTHEQRQRLNTTQKPESSALVIGNPTMPTFGEPPQPLNALPYAESEAQAIASLLNVDALTGDHAMESDVVPQMQTARIIHLATHGLLSNALGWQVPGAIALAPSQTDDGLLTADEILNLSLHAELVVLSACNTGRGRVTSDGVVGLSRSFITAGASSVVVSLWAVPDESTSTLMTAFYRNLQLNSDKAVALRQAMISTMQQYPSSRDWAAFTFIGNAE